MAGGSPLLLPVLLSCSLNAEDLPELSSVNGWLFQQEGNLHFAAGTVTILPKAVVLGVLSKDTGDQTGDSTSAYASLYGGVEVHWVPINGQHVVFDCLGSATSNLVGNYPLNGLATLSWGLDVPTQNANVSAGVSAFTSQIPQTSQSYFQISQTGTAGWTLKGDHSEGGVAVAARDLRFLQPSQFWSGNQRDSISGSATLHGEQRISTRLALLAQGGVESVHWESNQRLQNGSAMELEGGIRCGLTERLTLTVNAGAVNWDFAAPYAQDPAAQDQHSVSGLCQASLVWEETEDEAEDSRFTLSATQELLPGLNSNLSTFQHLDFFWDHRLNTRMRVTLRLALGRTDDQGDATVYGPPEREAASVIQPMVIWESVHAVTFNIYATRQASVSDLNGDFQNYSFGVGAGTIF